MDRTNKFWQLNFGMRPGEEFYDLTADVGCVNNVAGKPAHEQQIKKLRERMEGELQAQNDPRMFGNGKIFDNYPAINGVGFYDKFQRGEKAKAGWIEETDLEKEPLTATAR